MLRDASIKSMEEAEKGMREMSTIYKEKRPELYLPANEVVKK